MSCRLCSCPSHCNGSCHTASVSLVALILTTLRNARETGRKAKDAKAEVWAGTKLHWSFSIRMTLNISQIIRLTLKFLNSILESYIYSLFILPVSFSGLNWTLLTKLVFHGMCPTGPQQSSASVAPGRYTPGWNIAMWKGFMSSANHFRFYWEPYQIHIWRVSTEVIGKGDCESTDFQAPCTEETQKDLFCVIPGIWSIDAEHVVLNMHS